MDDGDRGRAAYRRRAWLEAFDAFGRADHAGGLAADDLELMAACGYMLDRYDEAWQALDHAHRIRLRGGDPTGAARCAVWLGLGLLAVGEVARAAGWFGRAGRLLDGVEQDCVERGYLLIPAVLEELDAGRAEAALRVSTRVAEIGERFSEPDLVAFALVKGGRAQLKLGRPRDGLALLDEAMVGLMAGELSSPVLTGLLYCSGIDACHEVHELRRARAWTAALTSWCDAQPEMVNFSGLCRVHRAEIMQLGGAWPEALAEAGRARERLAARYPQAAGAARYRQGELLRLLGRLDQAEDAFREANRSGWSPQPGLALLRLAQGRADTAAATIQRVLAETTDRLERARLLPAAVEILLAAADPAGALDAARELTDIAEEYPADVLGAEAAVARAEVALAAGDPRTALIALRRSCAVLHDVGVPYELARARLLISLACRMLGDEDSAALELGAARTALTRLGAVGDLARLNALAAAHTGPAGLSARELQVLRLVAEGHSNRAIAAELVLSERTVDRHVSNILTKLDVPSRTAATAYAYRHQLM
jgi:DNA-binding CsgD family transcriptional regulator